MLKIKSILSTSTILVLVLFSCTNTIEEVKEASDSKEKPIKESFNIVYHRSQNGIITNRLSSPYVKNYKNDDTVFPEGFLLEILDSNLEVTAHLQAKFGHIFGESKKMLARDSVIFVNVEGDELYTEELIWQQDSGRIYTDKFVKIKKKDVVLLGKGLESNEDFSKYVLKNITGQYYFNEKEVIDEKDE
jgi:LPS export ABC transporter protein LptC